MELNSEGIPLVLGKLIEYFVEKEDRLKVHGIFRKSGFISD